MSYQTPFLELLATVEAPRHPTLVRLVLPIEDTDALAWLAAQPLFPQFFWRSRSGHTCSAGCGRCDIKPLASLHAAHEDWPRQSYGAAAHLPWRYYGGHGFTPDDARVSALGGNQLTLPQWEIRREAQQSYLLCHLTVTATSWPAQYQALAAAQLPLMSPAPLTEPLPGYQCITQTPAYDQWRALIERVTQPEQLAQTPKVVLSRTSQLRLAHAINPWLLLHHWRQQQPQCYQFGWAERPGIAFLGCPPERLFLRQQQQLFTEALAGTYPQTGAYNQDQHYAQALLADAKNQRENQWVVDDIAQQLAPLTTQLHTADAELVTLRNVCHLRRQLHGTLHPSTRDQQLLAALHPTAAIGGYPRAAARAFLARFEPVQRDWYAGIFGYTSEQESEFCVTIRSALLQEQTLTTYAGAGILAGSEPAAEWQELNNKQAGLLNLFASL